MLILNSHTVNVHRVGDQSKLESSCRRIYIPPTRLRSVHPWRQYHWLEAFSLHAKLSYARPRWCRASTPRCVGRFALSSSLPAASHSVLSKSRISTESWGDGPERNFDMVRLKWGNALERVECSICRLLATI